MTLIAQGINKTVTLAKQGSLGTPATTGGTLLRRITSVFTAARNTFANNEIVSHEQSTGIAYGLKVISGKLSGLLSSGTYSVLMGAIMRADFAVGATSGALITVTAASTGTGTGTFTRSAGSFLTDGFKLFDVIRATGWASPATGNNNRNMLITALTATVMTVLCLDGGAVVAKAAGDSVTTAVAGKKTKAPLTSQTQEYFSLEEFYADVTKSELFSDLQPSQIDIGLPATGNATFACDMIGTTRTRATAQQIAAPAAASTTSVVTAIHGLLYANNVAVGNITGAQLTIKGNVQQADAILGTNTGAAAARGRIEVSGQFTALFTDTTLQDLYDAETPISLVLIAQDNPSVGLSDFMVYNMGRIKLTGDAADDGEKNITRTFPFTAEINTAGGAALANDNTILSIQDSAA